LRRTTQGAQRDRALLSDVFAAGGNEMQIPSE
jgi:hypothetical protein